MMLYDIFGPGKDFSRCIPLCPPTDEAQWAENKNWDGHRLYADRRADGVLEWRRAEALSEAAQRRHGVGPVVERERAVAEAARKAKAEREDAARIDAAARRLLRDRTLVLEGLDPISVAVRRAGTHSVRVEIAGEARVYDVPQLVAARHCDERQRRAWDVIQRAAEILTLN